jgi:hypothetical protein
MSKLIIIIGLPGSGKTHYLNELKQRHEIAGFYDDYQYRAYGKYYDPRLSRHYGPLLSKLNGGRDMAISDIIYTRQKDLTAVVKSVLAVLPETHIELHYFENSPRKTAANARNRAREKTLERELAFIKNYSPRYKVALIKKLPVYSPPKTTK